MFESLIKNQYISINTAVAHFICFLFHLYSCKTAWTYSKALRLSETVAYIIVEGLISFFVVVSFNLQPPGLPLLPTPTTIPSGRPQYRPENKHNNNQVSGLSFHFLFIFSWIVSYGYLRKNVLLYRFSSNFVCGQIVN